MWTGLLSGLAGALDKLMSFLPQWLARKGGMDAAEKKVLENTIESREKGDKAAAKVKEKLRDTPASKYVRDNDI